jgi:ankyrin repeat protein
MKSLKEVLEECQYEFLDESITDVNQHSVSGDTPLHVVSFRGDIESIKVLLEAGADIDAIGDLERTPLYSAIMGDHPDAVKFLIDHGCSLFHQDDGGKTPLDYACSLQLGKALAAPEIIPLLRIEMLKHNKPV